MAHICRGKNIVQFGPSFITNLLQTGACRKNPHGFDRETCPLVGQTLRMGMNSTVLRRPALATNIANLGF